VAILPPAASVAEGTVISYEELFAYGLIVGPWWETSTPYFALKASHPVLLHNAISVRISFQKAYVPLVVSGAGAAILPRFVGALAASAGAKLAELPSPMLLKATLIYRTNELAPAARAFHELTIQMFGQT
jgi:DNA-binding transcriptional LysR family regulator